MHVTEPTPLRADAERNRRQIIEAATEAFSSRGAEVPMDEIAKAAGVGVGTLYRRFPDRKALVVAAVRQTLESLVHSTEKALAEEPTAWDALVACMENSRNLRLIAHPDHPIPPDLAAHLASNPDLEALRGEFAVSFDRVVSAAQAEGSVRRDIDTGDVILLFAMVKRASKRDPDDDQRASERSLSIILDGLSTRPPRDLPGTPIGLDRLLERRRRLNEHLRTPAADDRPHPDTVRT